ncbi:MAG: hypothetical protein PVH91_15590 [Pseudomonadales bacterium]
MENLAIALILLVTAGYAVLVAVSIHKGKRWAVEVARAISMLDPQGAAYDLRLRAVLDATPPPEPEGTAARDAQDDRLAA